MIILFLRVVYTLRHGVGRVEVYNSNYKEIIQLPSSTVSNVLLPREENPLHRRCRITAFGALD